jgi:hypothetical protein
MSPVTAKGVIRAQLVAGRLTYGAMTLVAVSKPPPRMLVSVTPCIRENTGWSVHLQVRGTRHCQLAIVNDDR